MSGAAKPSLAPTWSNPDRLSITGAVAFTREEILRGLAADLEVQLAASREKGLEEYQFAIEGRFLAGYKHSGYADVRVDCRADSASGKILVRINEGPRYVNGAIRVYGAVKIPAKELIQRLQQPTPPVGAQIGCYDEVNGRTIPRWVDNNGEEVTLLGPIWEKGNPAAFDEGAIQSCHDRVARALDELGYPTANFQISLEHTDPAHSATLAIYLSDEGPDPIVTDITVMGNHISSDSAVCNYLQLHPGAKYSGEAVANWREQLWSSGRFISCNFSAERSADYRGLRLYIRVVEYKKAPPLDKPLPAENVAMLKFREWLTKSAEHDGDVVLELNRTPGGSVPTIIASRDGLLIYFREQKLNPNGFPRTEQAWAFTGDQFAWYSIARHEKFVASMHNPCVVSCGVQCIVPNDAEQVGKLNISAGITPEAGTLPLKLSLGGTPTGFIDIAQGRAIKLSISGGILTVRSTEGQEYLRIDAATGRLLNDPRTMPPEKGPRFWLEKGRFRSTLDQIEKTATKIFEPIR